MFKDDLKVGEALEMRILKKIQEGKTPLFGEACPEAIKIEGYFKEYDLWIPELEVRVEVKQDIKSQHTGNYVIELEYGGKPSAFSTSKADYWVIYDGKCEIWTTKWRIKRAVKGLKPVEFIGRGDTKSKKAYLCPTGRIKNTAEFVIYEIHS